MANTFSQLHLHIVFGVKAAQCTIPDDIREELHKEITGIVKNRHCHLRAVGSVADHIHIVLDLSTSISLADLMRDIKAVSSKWINDRRRARTFSWQSGYAAFSVSHSGLERVIEYVMYQKEHHRNRTFREEYLEFLKLHGLDPDERYMFDD
jgi:REP element-mobilizing transposase RayT